ncbi:universal stress protein [Nitrosovibrio sp. Nv17]|uniref:universal stress protein n=1 Tax=Nitrosovibrio sp. Nv17 TaxID=1855339 RepID=UPI0009091B96|nr:universal stress protein [Nitrosovibrio sp. Nv17]SFW16630.1 Nucleotide-binding universal stress protein, UspA family [Nitrosovibrio sp. Nv17]
MDILIQKIMLATDFSDASQDAIHHARWMAGALGAELAVLHVFEPSGWMVPSPYYYTPGFEEWVNASIEKTRQKGRDALEALAQSLGDDIQALFVEGSPGKEIVRVATEQGTDLLVLGTHGYSGWNYLTLGSIAQFVVRHAPCAVLTVKPDGEREEKNNPSPVRPA